MAYEKRRGCGHLCTRRGETTILIDNRYTIFFLDVGMVQPEKKLLWHPTRSNRFIVGGGNPGQIKVYDWDGKTDITEVTALGDLQHMKVSSLMSPTMECSSDLLMLVFCLIASPP